MVIMANSFEKSIFVCALSFSLPAKRILNLIYIVKTNRYLNIWRIEIIADIGIFICILMWVIVIRIDKVKRSAQIEYEVSEEIL
jgi:energy-converting hydrogenase Eha subunit C